MSVSVVVTNHNYADYLGAALASLDTGTERPGEVIVVDDGSTDGSRMLLDRLPEVRTLFLDGCGQTAAMNAGAALATGDIVVFLDADDVLLPDGLRLLREPFANPEVAAVHGVALEMDASGRLTDRCRPRGPMPHGDLAEKVRAAGPGSYEPPPTSGNAWSRRFLDAVMPLPELESQIGRGSAHADLFLADLAPFYGDVMCLATPVAGYRLHGRNDFATEDEQARFDRDVWCFEQRAQRLEHFLRARGEVVDIDAWRRSSWVPMVQNVYRSIDAAIGPDARFLLVDEQQLPTLAPRRAVPFTCRADTYAGPPADDAVAIAETEARRSEGVKFVVVAWPAFWWLSFYTGWADHLETAWQRVVSDDLVRIYRAL